MRCGLFGKIQAKRDFIAVGTPRSFLDVWEPWTQSAISASRSQLGREWQPAFLTAPVWRFWLGSDLCGKTVLGATMASMDGIGRHFPLTLIALASETESLAPPEIDPQDRWFAAAESFLYMTLEKDCSFEDIKLALESLPLPAAVKPGEAPQGALQLSRGASLARVASASFVNAFANARAAGHGLIYASTTCWWTAGGENYAPLTLTALRMPDPYLYAGMLTGRFENEATIGSPS
jgi:type VI secretion system protein ImpM